MHISRADIESTHAVIAPHVRTTPAIALDRAEFGLPPGPLLLKLELMQHGGSFKARGAFANLLLRDVPAAGIVAASGGNHGAAAAYAAMRLGRRATIFVPSISSPAKVQRIRDYGADLVVGGERYADALVASEKFQSESGALAVHAFDSRETMLGTGTLAREFEAQSGPLDSLLVGVGGGGLVGGVAAWHAGHATRVVGVEPEEAPTLTRALAAGGPVDSPAGGIAADSLAPRQIGRLVFPIARDHVDRVVLVDDATIRDAQRRLWQVLRVVAEPGGVAALAALLSGRYQAAPGERVGIVVSGANTTAVDFDR